MTYCKQIPLPVLQADIEKIKFFYKNGYKLFKVRDKLIILIGNLLI